MRRAARHIASIGAAVLVTAVPLAAQNRERIWEVAINCAALDMKRADLLVDIPPPAPALAGTAEEAERSARAYLRIAAEALDCPAPEDLNRMLHFASIGAEHRMNVAAEYGLTPEIMALGLASETELTCALYIDPDLLADARAAETTPTSTAPLCGW